jgi:hypothetical protein
MDGFEELYLGALKGREGWVGRKTESPKPINKHSTWPALAYHIR